jgi:alpha-L-fucosidase
LRCHELIDKYLPDLLYFDDDELPLGAAGLNAAAHFYNRSIERNGSVECVLFAKHARPEHAGAFTLDIERSRSTEILAQPWQTDTCIGDWHYSRSIFERHAYKTAEVVIPLLIDIVSKNGNLLLSIPVRGDGTIDRDEHAFLNELASWIPRHGEAIFGTRPFAVFGEGPPEPIEKNFSEKVRPYTGADIRFTTRPDRLYAFLLGWPEDGVARITTLRLGGEHTPAQIHRVEIFGNDEPLRFTQSSITLEVTLPSGPQHPYPHVLRIYT